MEEERHRLFSREEEHRKEGFFVRFVAVEQTVGHLHRRRKARRLDSPGEQGNVVIGKEDLPLPSF